MSLNTNISIGVSATQTKVNDLDNAYDRVDWSQSLFMSDGTGIGEADVLYHDRISVSAASPVSLSVDGLVNKFQDPIRFGSVKFVGIRNNSTSHPITFDFQNGTDITIQPGQLLLQTSDIIPIPWEGLDITTTSTSAITCDFVLVGINSNMMIITILEDLSTGSFCYPTLTITPFIGDPITVHTACTYIDQSIPPVTGSRVGNTITVYYPTRSMGPGDIAYYVAEALIDLAPELQTTYLENSVVAFMLSETYGNIKTLTYDHPYQYAKMIQFYDETWVRGHHVELPYNDGDTITINATINGVSQQYVIECVDGGGPVAPKIGWYNNTAAPTTAYEVVTGLDNLFTSNTTLNTVFTGFCDTTGLDVSQFFIRTNSATDSIQSITLSRSALGDVYGQTEDLITVEEI